MFSQETMSTLSLERFLHKSLHMVCLPFEGRTSSLIFSDGMCGCEKTLCRKLETCHKCPSLLEHWVAEVWRRGGLFIIPCTWNDGGAVWKYLE